jgi:hypothetical protein
MLTKRSLSFSIIWVALVLPALVSGEDRTRLTTEQSLRLDHWYRAVGTVRRGETFGDYLGRAAATRHGARYEEVVPPPGIERLRVRLDQFECVSFIESSLAVARCGWRGTTTDACFERELIASRYRGGDIGDYASRLHYFTDWIQDNEARHRVRNLTPSLGGRPVYRDFFYITSRELQRSVVPSTQTTELHRELAATEARLSATPHAVLDRVQAPPILAELHEGDLVAFVWERPGMLIHHAGFVHWSGGQPRLLHASSYHHRVVITATDVQDYLLRRPERRGVLVVRPLPPEGTSEMR